MKNIEYRLCNPTIDYKESGIIILMWNVVDMNDVPETFSFSFTLNELYNIRKTVFSSIEGNDLVGPCNMMINKAIEESVFYITKEYIETNHYNDITLYDKDKIRLEIHSTFLNNNIDMILQMKRMLNDYIKKLNVNKSNEL